VPNDGTRLSVEEWKPDAHQPGQVQVIKWDIARPSFGWSDERFAAVAADHDLIIHSAALLRFDLSYDDSAVVNVEGTRHALALAALGGMAFLHISTAYVCGQAEGMIEEAPLLGEGRFSNGYEASKAAAEESRLRDPALLSAQVKRACCGSLIRFMVCSRSSRKAG
jgi:thioester reductase-like protein